MPTPSATPVKEAVKHTAKSLNAVLLRAVDALKERGFAKDILEDEAGRICLLGAINCAHHGDPYYTDMNFIARALRKLGFASVSEAAKWNNERPRKAAEVIARLRKGARSARAGDVS